MAMYLPQKCYEVIYPNTLFLIRWTEVYPPFRLQNEAFLLNHLQVIAAPLVAHAASFTE
jgi:hypothetical protein